MQTIAGFTGAAVTDAVRQYDEMRVAGEKLSFIEQLAGESRAQESASGPSRPVHDQYSVAHDTRRVAKRRPNRSIVKFQLWEYFTCFEFEILDYVVRLDGGWIGGKRIYARDHNQTQGDQDLFHHAISSFPSPAMRIHPNDGLRDLVIHCVGGLISGATRRSIPNSQLAEGRRSLKPSFPHQKSNDDPHTKRNVFKAAEAAGNCGHDFHHNQHQCNGRSSIADKSKPERIGYFSGAA